MDKFIEFFATDFALLMLAGDFVPGFSAIDTQAQILAYALAFSSRNTF